MRNIQRAHALTTSDRQASPKNKDMYIWREIFRLYIEWKVFQGANSMTYSKDKMQGFVEEIEKMKLVGCNCVCDPFKVAALSNIHVGTL